MIPENLFPYDGIIILLSPSQCLSIRSWNYLEKTYKLLR